MVEDITLDGLLARAKESVVELSDWSYFCLKVVCDGFVEHEGVNLHKQADIRRWRRRHDALTWAASEVFIRKTNGTRGLLSAYKSQYVLKGFRQIKGEGLLRTVRLCRTEGHGPRFFFHHHLS